jgi:uncharacterized repeat protein (TIGR02543 family)
MNKRRKIKYLVGGSLAAIAGLALVSCGGNRDTKYTVSFEVNDPDTTDSILLDAINPVTVKKESTVALTELTYDGYTFGGWFTDESLTNQFTSTSKITADTTLYAKWTKNSDANITTITMNNVRYATIAAALAAIDQLRDDVFGVLGDGETIASTFETIKEIADFLDTHDESIGALANLISDVGIASVPESSVGAGDGTAATGLHADVEDLQTRVTALQAANGTNVSKTKSGSADAGNGQLYLDGVLTTVYSDTNVWDALGESTDEAAAAGTTAWSRIKNAENDIDTLDGKVGASTDTANSAGTTLWSRLLALEAIDPTKVDASTTNGNIKIDNVETQVYDDSDVVASIGASTDTASSSSTVVWPRLLNAEGDIDTLESNVGASTDTADSSGTTLWSRVKAIEGQPDPVQVVSTMPQTVDSDVLYMLEIQ